MMRSLICLLILISPFAVADEPAKSPHIVWSTTDPTFPVAKFQSGCAENMECFLTIVGDGQEIVRINQHTGKVTVAHPEKMDAAARQFWLAVTKAFGELKCADPTKK